MRLIVAWSMRYQRPVMLHRGQQTLLQALALSLAACSGSFDPAGGPAADAGPDQLARDDFELNVAPLFELHCNACHEAGGVAGSPAFSASYDSVLAYVPLAGGTLIGCTAADSLLYTKGSHVSGAGPAFDTTTESPKVANFIALWATAQPECEGGGEAKPATGSLVFAQGANSVDLSGLGVGLEGATLTFFVDPIAGSGLNVNSIKLNAGAGGLHVVHPRFELCPAGTATPANDSFSLFDATVPASSSADLLADNNVSATSLVGVNLGDEFSLRFAALTPAAGSQGPAVDGGGACAP